MLFTWSVNHGQMSSQTQLRIVLNMLDLTFKKSNFIPDIYGDIYLPVEMSHDELLAAIDIDQNVTTSGNLSDEELIQEAKRRRGDIQEIDIEEEEEELLPEEVTAALKVVRKFAQKNCSEKDVLSLRNIEREITVKKICLQRGSAYSAHFVDSGHCA